MEKRHRKSGDEIRVVIGTWNSLRADQLVLDVGLKAPPGSPGKEVIPFAFSTFFSFRANGWSAEEWDMKATII
jgi:hypothetical protein